MLNKLNNSDPSKRAHAKLSASQTKRWMNCPGSVKLIDDIPLLFREKQSHSAALGTAAHSLCEICLTIKVKDCSIYKGHWIHLSGKIQNKKPDKDLDKWFEVDYDMIDAVNIFLTTVFNELERLGPATELFFEKKFDLSWVRPNMFGTNDVSLSLFLDELVVIDYKHGVGVPIEVSYLDDNTGKIIGNSQLMYYLLGAAKEFDFTHYKYTIIVVQPRCPHPRGGVRRFTCTLNELMEFKDNLAKSADIVEEASNNFLIDKITHTIDNSWVEKYLKPGDHCKSSFCAKIGNCPALNKLTEQEALIDFNDDPPNIIPYIDYEINKLAKSLKWVPIIDARNRAIEALAQRIAEQGVKIPGQKLVRKKANRKWVKDEEEIIQILTKEGLNKKDFMSLPELYSPSKIEKLGPIGRKLVKGVKSKDNDKWEVEPLAEKSLGGLTLTDESDPRDEVIVDFNLEFPDLDQESLEEV